MIDYPTALLLGAINIGIWTFGYTVGRWSERHEAARLNRALSLREEEAVDMANLWWMACECVGVDPDSSGGAFRDAVRRLKVNTVLTDEEVRADHSGD